MARLPLPGATLLYAAGLLVGLYVPLPVTCLFVFSFAAGIATLVSARARLSLLALFLPLAGWTNFAVHTRPISPNDLRIVVSNRVEYVTIRGRLQESPVLRISERRSRSNVRSMAEISTSAILLGQEWKASHGRITASVPGNVGDDFHVGAMVEIKGVLGRPPSIVAPGQFDYRAYLAWQGIYYQLRCESVNDWQLCPAGERRQRTRPWGDRFTGWAQATLGRGLSNEDESLRLLWAMILGWKTGLTPEVSEPFIQSGTMHIFAISGLHIALIAGILVSVSRVLRVPRGASGLLVIPLIWFYTAATGWQASAIRSTVMMTVVIAGWALKRPSDLINSLAAAGLVILIWQPTQLFQASFQLSFFVVLGIAVIVPPLEKMRQKLLAPDPLLLSELRPRWQRWLERPIRVVTMSLATSTAAWLGSMPLIAFYFYMITPGSLLANLVIVPLSSLALMSSLGSLVCGTWCPFLTELFNHSAWLWMELMIRASAWFAALPGAYFYVRQPDRAEFVIYYLLLGGLLSSFSLLPNRRVCGGVAAATLLLAWALHRQFKEPGTSLTVLPARAGAVFVDGRGEEDLLIDCGDATSGDWIVKPFLRSQGINRMGGLLLSHLDLAHAGGTEVITSRFKVRQILTGPVRVRSAGIRQLLARLERTPGKCRVVQRGGPICGWNVLHPDAQDKFARGDDGALVLQRQFHDTRVLLVSDLGRLGQKALLQRETNLRADILVAGLSNKEFLSEAFLDAVKPRLLIVASAEYPVANRPGQQLRDRLARWNIPVVYTSEAGAAVVRFGREGWQITTMDGRHAQAGTLEPYVPGSPASNNDSAGEAMHSEPGEQDERFKTPMHQ